MRTLQCYSVLSPAPGIVRAYLLNIIVDNLHHFCLSIEKENACVSPWLGGTADGWRFLVRNTGAKNSDADQKTSLNGELGIELACQEP